MISLLAQIVLPLLIASLVEASLLRLIASALRWKSILWSHCFLFAFLAFIPVLMLRGASAAGDVQLGLVSAVIASLALHSAVAAVYFRRTLLPTGAPLGAARSAALGTSGFIATAIALGLIGVALNATL